jgi:methionine sulfoxide reductase heme-binding subunit
MENATVIPWDWYIVRASALVGFLLLYISIFTGTVSGLPGIKKYFLRLRSLNFHCWISFQALFFALIHGIALLFHKFIPFSLADILIPFHANYEPLLVALGTISLYLMIILVATSYARKYISQKLWRSIHFLNIALYAFSIIHALYLGSDLKSGLFREIFIWANGFLVLLLVYNMFYRIWLRIKNKNIQC